MAEKSYRCLFLFAGSGSGAAGFMEARSAKSKFEFGGAVDYDAGAAKDFKKLTGHDCTVADLSTMTPEELRSACGGVAPDMLFTSPPCLPSNGLVLTDTGPRRIDSLRANQMVLTHRGRYRPIEKIGTHQYVGTMFGIRLNGTVDRQWFTAEHPMWCRRLLRVAGEPGSKLSEPEFVPASEIKIGDRIGFPVDTEIKGTAVDVIGSFGNPAEFERGGHSIGKPYSKPRHTVISPRIVDLRPFAESAALWFLVGVYLGDGYRRKSRHEVCFCIGPSDAELAHQVRQALTELGLKWFEDEYGGIGNIKIRVTAKHLCQIMGLLGDGAEQKEIPLRLMNLEIEHITNLIRGYIATDGCYEPRRQARNELQARTSISSVSLPLLRSVQRIMLRTNEFGMIHKARDAGTAVIEGRTVNTKPMWTLVVAKDPIKRTTYEFIDGAVWVRVRSIETTHTEERVWNLEVREDNTFCVPMMATHNCVSFSSCMPLETSLTPRYVDMANLVVRGLFLTLEAFPEKRPRLILLENVPMIQTRGKELLSVVIRMLRSYGYAVRESVHDCGELGGLAQRRKRFLMVARHTESTGNYWREPPKQRVRGIGEILGELPIPLPNSTEGGPMHRLPMLSALNWLRLALIPPGGDWRDLPEKVMISPRAGRLNGGFGVEDWSKAGHAVLGEGTVRNTRASVADPRPMEREDRRRGERGVRGWSQSAMTVIGHADANTAVHVADPRLGPLFESIAAVAKARADGDAEAEAAAMVNAGRPDEHDPRTTYESRNGHMVQDWNRPGRTVIGQDPRGLKGAAVADPRLSDSQNRHTSKYAVSEWDDPSKTVTGCDGVGDGAQVIADPRLNCSPRNTTLGVVDGSSPSGVVLGAAQHDNGAFSVADPRVDTTRREGGHGVKAWDDVSTAVIGNAQIHNWPAAVADPRLEQCQFAYVIDTPDGVAVVGAELDLSVKGSMKNPPIIIARDGTWHRPMTTLELAALQSFPVKDENGEWLVLDGEAHAAWRKHIGNAVPWKTATAIGASGLACMESSDDGILDVLGFDPIWVSPRLQESEIP